MLGALYAKANTSVCPSVYPSVTRVDQLKTVEVRIVQFSPYSSPIPLYSFCALGFIQKFWRPPSPLRVGRQTWVGETSYSIQDTTGSCMRFQLAPRSMNLDDLELDGGRPPFFQMLKLA